MHSNDLIVIRTEASNTIGYGHIIRCLALAKYLSKKAKVIFFSQSDAVIKKCIDEGLEYVKCENDISAIQNLSTPLTSYKSFSLIIDTKKNYSESETIMLKKFFKKIFFIENNSIGTIHSAGVIYPAAHFDYDNVYRNSNFEMPMNKIIHGGDYVLIRDELKNLSSKKGGGIVVTAGASDPNKVMLKLDEVLANLQIKAKFLIGEKFNYSINKLGLENKSEYLNYSSEYIANADIVISTFGVSIYEALFFNKPIISIGHNMENSDGSSILAKKSNMIKDLGFYKSISDSDLNIAINKCMKMSISENNLIIDGFGAARISNIILKND